MLETGMSSKYVGLNSINYMIYDNPEEQLVAASRKRYLGRFIFRYMRMIF